MSNSNNPGSSKSLSNHKSFKSSKSLLTSSNNILSNENSSASTPYSSIIDPNDEIWIEFLNSLNEPYSTNNNQQNKSVNLENPSKEKTDDLETRTENDDCQDDPDFTVCLDNYDLENDPDYMDDWLQIPKKEAVELVKDAIEICEGAPLVYDDQRHSKLKSANTIKKLSSELSTKNNLKSTSSQQLTESSISIIKINESPTCNEKVFNSTSYVPAFTDIEHKQLDEQLRNHVQMLTQTCLVCYCSREYNYVYEEALSLLNVLSSLTKHESDSIKLSKEFEIINLNPALEIIEQIKAMNKEEICFDLKQGIPSKFLEIILTSPVFYNTNLIPNLAKFKYQSHFKRSQFSDTEKILLIFGFNKFKHLPKSECCECIKEHLLPQRTCDDIRKQLNYFSNSEQRQYQLKELLKKQKQLNTNLLINFDFKKDVHYKSPYEQSEMVNLPSQYTIIIERIKLAKLLKETRNNSKDKEKTSTLNKDFNKTKTNTEILNEKNSSSAKTNRIRPPITKVAAQNKRPRSESPVRIRETNPRSPSPILVPSRSPSPVQIEKKPVSNNQPKQQQQQQQQSRIILSSLPIPLQTIASPQSTFILPSTNFLDLFTRQTNSIIQLPNHIQLNPNMNHNNNQPPVFLPSNFNGTVLIQPTIHIHTNSKNSLNIQNKYCKIKPKENLNVNQKKT